LVELREKPIFQFKVLVEVSNLGFESEFFVKLGVMPDRELETIVEKMDVDRQNDDDANGQAINKQTQQYTPETRQQLQVE
jgi:hypothetical protein